MKNQELRNLEANETGLAKRRNGLSNKTVELMLAEGSMSETKEISVHDNHLVSYEVFCERREIRLRTVFREVEPNEVTDVIFTGVLAYDFWHDGDLGTILFDVIEIPPERIYDAYAKVGEADVKYPWVYDWAKSSKTAREYFRVSEIKAFEVASSVGLSGWVLAKQMAKKVSTEVTHA